MSSGIQVNKEVLKKFNDIKCGKKIRYYTLELSTNEKEIIPSECVSKPDNADISFNGAKKEWENFCSDLPPNLCYYIIYDLNYERPDGERRDKILLISW